MSPKIFIGIEGIGTRYSVAVVSDKDGNIKSAVRLLLPLSLHTTPRPVLRGRLLRLIKAVLHPLRLRLYDLRSSVICIGMSGVTFKHNARVDLPDEFTRLEIFPERLICVTDTEIAFISHALSNRGSAVTCTMGSMAYIISHQQTFRVGGWGPTLGDEGSGYWMGRQAMKAIGQEVDSNLPQSILWAEIKKFLDNPERPLPEWKEHSIVWRKQCNRLPKDTDPRKAIFSFAHELSLNSVAKWRVTGSSLTIPLMRAWRKGDLVAESIVNDAANHLVRQFQQACETAVVSPDHGPLVLYGGVFTHNSDFLELVEGCFRSKCCPHITILSTRSPGTLRPACGALLLALGDSITGQLQLPAQDVMQRVASYPKEVHHSGALTND